MRRLSRSLIVFLSALLFASQLFCETVSLLNKSVDETIMALQRKLESPLSVTERVDVLNELAWSNIFGDPTLCQGYLEESLRLSVANDYVEGEAYAYDIWGSIFRVNGLYEESIKSHLKSLGLNEKISNPKGMAINYSNIGLVYAEEKDYEQSLNYHLEALKLKKQLQADPDGLAFTYNDLLYALVELKRLDEAIAYNEELINLLGSDRTDGALAPQRFNAARIEYARGNVGKAKHYLRLSDEELAIKRNFWIEIQCHMLWAKILAQENKLEEASKRALQAFELSEKYKMIDFQRMAAGLLAENYAAMGDFQNAYHYLGVQNHILDSHFGSDVKKKTAILTAKYEFDRKQSLLRSEFQKRAYKWGAGIVVLIILLVGSITFTVFYTRKARKLQRANKRIEEQKSLIESQAEHLKELNSTKDKVFSIVAHDLRSPLAALSSLLDLFAENTIGPNEFRKMADVLSRSVRTVNETLTQLLTWAKSQQNEMRPHPTKVHLYAVASRKIELFENTARLKNIELINSVPRELNVVVDEDHLLLVLHNLVNNALKFTKESGQVTIGAKALEAGIEVFVEDTGVGMDEVAKAKLFQQAYNRSSPGTRGERGTGLGLVLCKEMVELNGGTVSLESELGEGTTVSFTLPTD